MEGSSVVALEDVLAAEVTTITTVTLAIAIITGDTGWLRESIEVCCRLGRYGLDRHDECCCCCFRWEEEKGDLLVFCLFSCGLRVWRSGRGEVRMTEITDCGVRGRRSSGCGDSGNTIVASKELVQWGFTAVKGKWEVSKCMDGGMGEELEKREGRRVRKRERGCQVIKGEKCGERLKTEGGCVG